MPLKTLIENDLIEYASGAEKSVLSEESIRLMMHCFASDGRLINPQYLKLEQVAGFIDRVSAEKIASRYQLVIQYGSRSTLAQRDKGSVHYGAMDVFCDAEGFVTIFIADHLNGVNYASYVESQYDKIKSPTVSIVAGGTRYQNDDTHCPIFTLSHLLLTASDDELCANLLSLSKGFHAGNIPCSLFVPADLALPNHDEIRRMAERNPLYYLSSDESFKQLSYAYVDREGIYKSGLVCGDASDNQFVTELFQTLGVDVDSTSERILSVKQLSEIASFTGHSHKFMKLAWFDLGPKYNLATQSFNLITRYVDHSVEKNKSCVQVVSEDPNEAARKDISDKANILFIAKADGFEICYGSDNGEYIQETIHDDALIDRLRTYRVGDDIQDAVDLLKIKRYLKSRGTNTLNTAIQSSEGIVQFNESLSASLQCGRDLKLVNQKVERLTIELSRAMYAQFLTFNEAELIQICYGEIPVIKLALEAELELFPDEKLVLADLIFSNQPLLDFLSNNTGKSRKLTQSFVDVITQKSFINAIHAGYIHLDAWFAELTHVVGKDRVIKADVLDTMKKNCAYLKELHDAFATTPFQSVPPNTLLDLLLFKNTSTFFKVDDIKQRYLAGEIDNAWLFSMDARTLPTALLASSCSPAVKPSKRSIKHSSPSSVSCSLFSSSEESKCKGAAVTDKIQDHILRG